MTTYTKKQVYRRYYLHRKTKSFLKINTRDRSITVTDKQVREFTPRQSYMFDELRSTYNYSIQYEIPND